MPKPVIACDIDGVILDFFTSFLSYVNPLLGTNFTYEECDCHNLARAFKVQHSVMDQIHEGYKRDVSHDDILPIDGALVSLQQLLIHYEIAIITSRSPHYELPTRDWFARHLPEVTIHFSQGRNNALAGADGRVHKPQIAEQIGALCLIEDNEEEFIHWDAPGVQPICFAQPWNRCLVESHPQILRLDWPGITNMLVPSRV